jgi:glutamine amidotransferase
MIAIVNYGSGNIHAIGNIYNNLNIEYYVASTPEDLMNATSIILPGVGAFDQAMGELERSGMREALDIMVLEKKVNILGICVGMQLLAKTSDEGIKGGLGWINGHVKKFDHAKFSQATHLPHMGWNTVTIEKESKLFNNVDLELGYYFLHSYYFECLNKEDILTSTFYGEKFTSSVNLDNVYGAQFHPEKSHNPGIQLLKNFANL